MNNLDFVPKFLDELLANTSAEELASVKETCGDNDMCLFDTLSTKDEELGKSTMMINDMNTANQKEASKWPFSEPFSIPVRDTFHGVPAHFPHRTYTM